MTAEPVKAGSAVFQEEILEIIVVRKRIKNIYLRITRDRQVILTAPLRMPDKAIREFAEKKRDWIEKALEKTPLPVRYTYVSGEKHFVFGKEFVLHVYGCSRNGGALRKDSVEMYVHSEVTNREKLYKELARTWLLPVLKEMISYWSPLMKVKPGKITIRVMKSCWGSCNIRTHDISFSLDLFTKPESCIESVVVHELNHLLEPGHGPRFHALMAHWLPDYKDRKKELERFPKEFM